MSASRPLNYWACLFGVSTDTIAREFADETRKFRGRRVLGKKYVYRTYPDMVVPA